MSVERQLNVQGSMRLDAPHVRLVESGVCGDFDVLAGSIVSGRRALVVSGFTLATFVLGNRPELLTLIVAGSTALHYNATASGTIFSVPDDRPPEQLGQNNPRVSGGFSANAINYVSLDIRRAPDDTTKDFVVFLDDPEAGTEVERQIPLARTTDYVIVITTVPFSSNPNVLPIATVRTNTSGLTSEVLDARWMLGRLPAGGDLPNPASGWEWPEGRREVADQPFVGGDKAIRSLKDWMDAVMTRVWEIGGGERWYSAVSDRNVKFFRGGTTFGNGEYLEWDGTNLHWRGLSFVLPNSGGLTNAIVDQLTSRAGLTDLADGECVYVDLDYSADHTGAGTLALLKAPIRNLGAAVPSRSRTIIAWRSGASVFSRDSYYAVGSDLLPALRAAAVSNPLCRRSRYQGTTSADNNVLVQPLGTFFVTSGGTWVALVHSSASTIDVATLAGVSWAASTSFNIYAYDGGAGSVAFEVSTGAPDSALAFKAGDQSRAFVGFVISSEAGTPLRQRFRCSAGSWDFLNLLVVNKLGATGTEQVPTTRLYAESQVPRFASAAKIHFNATNTASPNNFSIGPTGSVAFGPQTYPDFYLTASNQVHGQLTVPYGSGASPYGLDYVWLNTGGSLLMYVMGCYL